MKLDYISLKNKTNLIEGVILHPLIINRDERGTLVESLRSDWEDVFDLKNLPFAMQYYSVTKPGTPRDNRWHFHKFQDDRFVVTSGSVITVLYDVRGYSKTRGLLNLLPMGVNQKDDNQFLLLIPKEVYHIYLVEGSENAILLNFPTRLYDTSDEGRIPFEEVIIESLGQPFKWDLLKSNSQ